LTALDPERRSRLRAACTLFVCDATIMPIKQDTGGDGEPYLKI
jgi:hypothetical protein